MWNTYEVHVVLDASSITPSEKLATELVPQSLHKFLHMFQKYKSEHMPIHKLWDHAIDIKDIFKAKKGILIPLLLQEQEKVFAFINKQLCKEYICLSKSPQISSMFFIPKKDGKKQMVQDYYYLNKLLWIYSFSSNFLSFSHLFPCTYAFPMDLVIFFVQQLSYHTDTLLSSC